MNMRTTVVIAQEQCGGARAARAAAAAQALAGALIAGSKRTKQWNELATFHRLDTRASFLHVPVRR